MARKRHASAGKGGPPARSAPPASEQGLTLAALGAVAAATFLDEGRVSPGSSQKRLPESTAGVAAAK